MNVNYYVVNTSSKNATVISESNNKILIIHQSEK